MEEKYLSFEISTKVGKLLCSAGNSLPLEHQHNPWNIILRKEKQSKSEPGRTTFFKNFKVS
jgi:hypothetical protein